MERLYYFSRIVFSLLAVAILIGCAGTPASSQDKIRRALDQNSERAADPYVLGPTDVVSVSVWRNPDLSLSVPVRPDGKISMPLVGDVEAAGRRPEELADTIAFLLDSYIREPQVSVVVTSMGSNEFRDRVRVTGAVQQPVSVPHRDGMTILDVFLSAGGASPFASLNESKLYRPMGNEVVAIPVKLNDIINNGDIKTNYPMKAGDILAVPERNF